MPLCKTRAGKLYNSKESTQHGCLHCCKQSGWRGARWPMLRRSSCLSWCSRGGKSGQLVCLPFQQPLLPNRGLFGIVKVKGDCWEGVGIRPCTSSRHPTTEVVPSRTRKKITGFRLGGWKRRFGVLRPGFGDKVNIPGSARRRRINWSGLHPRVTKGRGHSNSQRCHPVRYWNSLVSVPKNY